MRAIRAALEELGRVQRERDAVLARVMELEAQVVGTRPCLEFCELAQKDYKHHEADWLHRAELELRIRQLEEQLAHCRADQGELTKAWARTTAERDAATLAERERCLGAVEAYMRDIPWHPAVIPSELAKVRALIESPTPCPTCGSSLDDGTDTASWEGITRHCRCLQPYGCLPLGGKPCGCLPLGGEK